MGSVQSDCNGSISTILTKGLIVCANTKIFAGTNMVKELAGIDDVPLHMFIRQQNNVDMAYPANGYQDGYTGTF